MAANIADIDNASAGNADDTAVAAATTGGAVAAGYTAYLLHVSEPMYGQSPKDITVTGQLLILSKIVSDHSVLIGIDYVVHIEKQSPTFIVQIEDRSVQSTAELVNLRRLATVTADGLTVCQGGLSLNMQKGSATINLEFNVLLGTKLHVDVTGLVSGMSGEQYAQCRRFFGSDPTVTINPVTLERTDHLVVAPENYMLLISDITVLAEDMFTSD